MTYACRTCNHAKRDHHPDGRWCWGERALWDRGGTSECPCTEFLEGGPPPTPEAESLVITGDLDSGWFFVKGDGLDDMPFCATCGARAVGVASDGGPQYPSSCIHPPIYPKKETT